MDVSSVKIRTMEDIENYEKIVLFGAGASSEATIRLLSHKNIVCLFDNDPEKWNKKFGAYIIRSPLEIKKIVDDATCIIISSVSYQYEIASDLINKYNISQKNIFSYTSKHCEDFIYSGQKIIDNYDKIEKILDLLEDISSKEYVENSIKCRLTRNPLYLKDNINIKIPYEYSNIVLPKRGDIIIDCGAYNGDTAELFLKKLQGEAVVYCIEPFKSSYDELCDNIMKNNLFNKVKCFNNAVSNEKRVDIIRCNEDDVFMSANLSNEFGELYNKINVDKLDNLFKDIKEIDFIKMDIEGEEVKALQGAKNIIKRFNPRMMVSAYHIVEHIWEIPEVIKSINQNYKIYAGHQPNAPFEIEYYITI